MLVLLACLLFLLTVTSFTRSLWSFHETPIDVDFLSEDFCSIHCFFGSECLLVCLVFDQSVAFQETGTSIEVQMNVFDVAKLAELFLYVIFMSLFVNGSDEQNPTLDGYNKQGKLRNWKR